MLPATVRSADVGVVDSIQRAPEGRHFPLPEHRFRLQQVDDECARSSAAWRWLEVQCTRHDLIARRQSEPIRWMTTTASRGHRLCDAHQGRIDALFGHARIMFEFEAFNRLVLELIANDAAERRHCTGTPASVDRSNCPFGTNVEILSLNCDARQHAQPPVIGGMNATSSPSRTVH